MAMAVSLIFRNINLQNWPHSFVKWLFYSLKVSALLEDLVAEDSYKGSWEAVKNVWKMEKSLGKVRKKSGNFEIENEWQPCYFHEIFTKTFYVWIWNKAEGSLKKDRGVAGKGKRGGQLLC